MIDTSDFDALADGMILTRREGGLRWLVFNQPEKLNAISLEMAAGALQVIEEFASDVNQRVLVLAGTWDRAFVSGADISEFDRTRKDAKTADEYGSDFQPV